MADIYERLGVRTIRGQNTSANAVIESRLSHDTCPRDDTSYAAMMDWFRFATRATSHSVERPFRGRNVLDVLDP